MFSRLRSRHGYEERGQGAGGGGGGGELWTAASVQTGGVYPEHSVFLIRNDAVFHVSFFLSTVE